jgi:hypothetical protein
MITQSFPVMVIKKPQEPQQLALLMTNSETFPGDSLLEQKSGSCHWAIGA